MSNGSNRTQFAKGNPGGPGRPRGRIAKLRQILGDMTDGGRTIAAELDSIMRDKAAPARERVQAATVMLSYLVGKPEASLAIDVSHSAPQLPADWGTMAPGDRMAFLEAIRVREIAIDVETADEQDGSDNRRDDE